MNSEKIFESFDDEEYRSPNEITTKIEFSKPEIEKEGTYTFTIVNALISNLSSGKSREFTIQYTESEYGVTVEVYDNESQLDKTHIYMETTSLENDFDTEERTDWLYDNLPDLTKELLHSKMLSKDLSEKLAYTILDNATSLAVGYSIGIENLQEAAGDKKARRRVWGEDWNAEHAEYTGASNLDFFGRHILEEIEANLKEITCKVGGKIKLAIDDNRIDLSIDKDPAPGESVKERRIRGWIYFKSNFNVIIEDRQVLKQKVIQAFKGGIADFNDKYKSDYLVCKDMTLISDSFKYGNDNKSMYFVFKVEEEKYHNEKPRAIIVESLDINDMFVQNAFPLTIDDNNVVITNATKPDYADYAGSNIGYYWWTEVEKESDASGPEEHTTIYYFETPSDLNKYLRQHPEKEKLVLRRIYENTNSKNLFDSILKESKRYYESYSDDLNEYQIDVIKDMAKMDIECGHPMDYDNALEACQEDEDLSDVAEEAAQYYIRLVGEGAAACYEELKDEYDDWDPDFVAEFEQEDDIPFQPSKETNINNTADWYKISQIESLMYTQGMSAEEAKKELGIDPSFKYIPTGNLN